ncbi:unnamed protein product [Rotaria sp. Silwood1]|nr:unnamed protein product [Rotaria sp. Silwood1]
MSVRDYNERHGERVRNAEEYGIQSFYLVRIAYDEKYLITHIEFIAHLNYKVCGYDGQIRNVKLTLDPRTDEERQAKINTIITPIPYGSYDRADQENVICRFIHTYFVPLLPSIHCPHVGPTGGEACTDKTIDF